MKIPNRITTKSNAPKYEPYKEKLIELCKRDGQASSRTFAACIFPPLCESGARKWLARFKADGIIKLVARSNVGRQIFMLTDSYVTTQCDPATSNTNNAQPQKFIY